MIMLFWEENLYGTVFACAIEAYSFLAKQQTQLSVRYWLRKNTLWFLKSDWSDGVDKYSIAAALTGVMFSVRRCLFSSLGRSVAVSGKVFRHNKDFRTEEFCLIKLKKEKEEKKKSKAGETFSSRYTSSDKRT